MPLSDFLSAVRCLVLDDALADAPPPARRREIARRFPQLTPAEADDLSAISPARLGVYTDLIFAGQRSQIEWTFPISLALIARIREHLGDDRPARRADFDLMREMHRFEPWRSASSRDLAALFQRFIAGQRPEWTDACPVLTELIDLERTDLDIFYAEDVDCQPLTDAWLHAIGERSVEQVMAIRFIRPSCTALRFFDHDVIAIAREFRHDQTLQEAPPQTRICAVGSRSPGTLLAEWNRVTPTGHDALAALPPARVHTVNDLASDWLARRTADDDSTGEAALFAEFFPQFLGWLKSGALLLAPS